MRHDGAFARTVLVGPVFILRSLLMSSSFLELSRGFFWAHFNPFVPGRRIFPMPCDSGLLLIVQFKPKEFREFHSISNKKKLISQAPSYWRAHAHSCVLPPPGGFRF